MRLPRIELPAVAAIFALTLGWVGYPLSDYDFFWHLRTGYLILETGTIPREDPFSFTAAGAPWEVQGWLFDLAMAWIHRSMGDGGLRLFFALWIITTWSVVHASVRLYVRDTSKALPITLASAVGASMYFVARPLVATLLGFALILYLLLKHRRSGRKAWLIGIPLVMAVWVNLHYGFVTGLGLIGLAFAADFLSRWIPIDGAWIEKGRLTPMLFLALLFACVVALGANPIGYEALTTMLEMTGRSAASVVLEWQSPDFHLPGPKGFLVPVGLALAANLLSRRRPDWIDIVLFFAMTGGALYSMRHMPLAAIALAPVVARGFSAWAPLPWANHWLVRLPTSIRRRGGEDLGDRVYLLNVLVLIAGLLAILAMRPVVQTWQDSRLRMAVPVAATDFLESGGLPGPILNEYAAGGYLIWRLSPGEKVFIDGRYTPYPQQVFDDYLRIVQMDQEWLGLLDRYQIQTVLMPAPRAGFVQALLASGRFRMVYEDGYFGVLVRSGLSAASN